MNQEKMKYLNITEPGSIQIETCEIPTPSQGEALLKLLYGGICGSDLGTYKGTFLYSSYPRIPGHEFSAEIVEVPENDYGLEKGMIVTANPYFNCGVCYSCRRGFVNCCTSNETLVHSETAPLSNISRCRLNGSTQEKAFPRKSSH